MGYVGYKTQGVAGVVAVTHQEKAACKFTVGARDLVADKIYAFVDAVNVAPTITMAVYTDNAGAPDALVANSTVQTSLAITAPAPGQIIGGQVAVPYVLTANTAYWICIQCEGAPGDALTVPYDAGAPNQSADPQADALPLSDPYGAVGGYSAFKMSMWIEDDGSAVYYAGRKGDEGIIRI